MHITCHRHKSQLQAAAARRTLRQGDWFCSGCGAHNKRHNTKCYRCSQPADASGNTSVSAEDMLSLYGSARPWERGQQGGRSGEGSEQDNRGRREERGRGAQSSRDSRRGVAAWEDGESRGVVGGDDGEEDLSAAVRRTSGRPSMRVLQMDAQRSRPAVSGRPSRGGSRDEDDDADEEDREYAAWKRRQDRPAARGRGAASAGRGGRGDSRSSRQGRGEDDAVEFGGLEAEEMESDVRRPQGRRHYNEFYGEGGSSGADRGRGGRAQRGPLRRARPQQQQSQDEE